MAKRYPSISGFAPSHSFTTGLLKVLKYPVKYLYGRNKLLMHTLTETTTKSWKTSDWKPRYDNFINGLVL